MLKLYNASGEGVVNVIWPVGVIQLFDGVTLTTGVPGCPGTFNAEAIVTAETQPVLVFLARTLYKTSSNELNTVPGCQVVPLSMLYRHPQAQTGEVIEIDPLPLPQITVIDYWN